MRLLPPPVAQRGVSTELDVDHALASLERLNEIAESMMRRLDELFMPLAAQLGHRANRGRTVTELLGREGME